MTNYRASCSWPQFYHKANWSNICTVNPVWPSLASCQLHLPTISCLIDQLTSCTPLLHPRPRAWSLVRSTLLSHQTTYLLPSLSSSESGIDLETGQCCKGENRKWGGSSETCDRNYNLRLLFYGTMQNKNEMFWSDPIIHHFKMYLFFYFASYPYHSSNSLNHVNPPMPLFFMFHASSTCWSKNKL